MSCKEPISFDFIIANTTKTFLNKKWREKRKEVLIDIEIAKLPTTQATASQYKEFLDNQKKLEEKIQEQRKITSETLKLEYEQTIEEKLSLMKKQLIACKRDKKDFSFTVEERSLYKKKYKELKNAYKTAQQAKNIIKIHTGELNSCKYRIRALEYQMTETDNEENNVTVNSEIIREANNFVMPCPLNDCKGFMSKQYKCGMCNGKICPKCHIEIKGKDEEHECNKELAESVKLINAETKPCPKCGARIHKLHGCDQMWCVSCKTAFSWNTGKIVQGERIHNPEYYRWMRDHNINLPREEDVYNNCAQVPNIYQINDLLNRRKITGNQESFLYNLVQKVGHFEQLIRENVPSVNRDLRVRFLCNELTKEKMTQTLIKRERINMKKNFLNGLYRLTVDVSSDILRRSVSNPSVINECTKEAVNLCKYINDQMKNFTNIHGLTTPQFDETIANLFNLRRIAVKSTKNEVEDE
jgi:hypothetical protein